MVAISNKHNLKLFRQRMKRVVSVLGESWMPFVPHIAQQRLWKSNARFRVAAAGRRSGKTAIAKCWAILQAVSNTTHRNGRYVLAAPTHTQARMIFWEDLVAMSPVKLVKNISVSRMSVKYWNGATITVMGMDKPMRVEGPPLDGIVLDEYGNMRPEVWTNHVRPALSTLGRFGWAWFIGVPEGRNHYYDLYTKARACKDGEWEAFHWISSDILPEEEIEQARIDLDELTYKQEYEASFVSFEGRTYYDFLVETHTAEIRKAYNPNKPLIFMLDFNNAPGVAAIAQEFTPGTFAGHDADVTGILGEVHIPQNSVTPRVCRKLIADWKNHRGPIHIYGDATGGAGGSAKVQGSDWDLVRETLTKSEDGFSEHQLDFYVPSSNPRERTRVNAVNSRIKSVTGKTRLLVDSVHAPNVIKDFEGVRCVKGGDGEIDKDSDKTLTHLSDAIGYYIVKRFPTISNTCSVQSL